MHKSELVAKNPYTASQFDVRLTYRWTGSTHNSHPAVTAAGRRIGTGGSNAATAIATTKHVRLPNTMEKIRAPNGPLPKMRLLSSIMYESSGGWFLLASKVRDASSAFAAAPSSPAICDITASYWKDSLVVGWRHINNDGMKTTRRRTERVFLSMVLWIVASAPGSINRAPRLCAKRITRESRDDRYSLFAPPRSLQPRAAPGPRSRTRS